MNSNRRTFMKSLGLLSLTIPNAGFANSKPANNHVSFHNFIIFGVHIVSK